MYLTRVVTELLTGLEQLMTENHPRGLLDTSRSQNNAWCDLATVLQETTGKAHDCVLKSEGFIELITVRFWRRTMMRIIVLPSQEHPKQFNTQFPVNAISNFYFFVLKIQNK